MGGSRRESFAGRRLSAGIRRRLPGRNIATQYNKRYLELAPERAYDLHGRGIAVARKLTFSDVEYRAGNEVLAIIAVAPPPATAPASTHQLPPQAVPSLVG